MKRTIFILSAVFALLLLTISLIAPVQAAECVWFGGDGDWSDSANWSGCGGGIPGVDDTAVIPSGAVTFDQTTTIAGLTMSGGELIGGGQILTVTTSILLTGEGNKRIAGMTLNNGGTAVWDDGTLTLGPWPEPLTFNNQAGATFEIIGARNTQPSQASIIANYGTLIKSGADLSDIANFGPALHNFGLVRVEEGELRVGGGNHTHAGAFEALAGATMQFDGTQHFGPTASINGDGSVGFIRNGGSFVLDPDMTYNIGGRTTLSCFGCAVRFHTTAVTGELALLPWDGQIPQIEGEGSLTVTGQTLWHQGVIGHTGNYSHNGPITVEMQGGLTLYGLSSQIMHDAIVRNHGAAVYNAGSFFIRYPTAHFINLPGASFTIEGPRDIDFYWGAQDLPLGRFINQGSLLKTGAGAATITSLIVENSGEIEVQEGSLHFLRHATLSQPWQGARLVLDGGVVNAAEPLLFQFSQLRGHGDLNAAVESNSYLWPGFTASETEVGFYEAGILEINGDLTMTGDSRTFALLVSADPAAGVGYSQLRVDSAVELSGTLSIRVDNGFIGGLGVGDEFAVMHCTQGCLGAFEMVDVVQDGFTFEVLYQANQVVVRCLEAPLADDPYMLYLPLTVRP